MNLLQGESSSRFPCPEGGLILPLSFPQTLSTEFRAHWRGGHARSAQTGLRWSPRPMSSFFKSLCQISRLGNVVSPRTFTTVWKLLCYNCSPVCGLPAWQLRRGANDNLLQEDLCLIPHIPGLLLSEPLSLLQATTDPCLHRRQTLKTSSGSDSCGGHAPFFGSWCTPRAFVLCYFYVLAVNKYSCLENPMGRGAW